MSRQAICQTSFMSFSDELVYSGVRLIITDRNGKFLGSHGGTDENTDLFCCNGWRNQCK